MVCFPQFICVCVVVAADTGKYDGSELHVVNTTRRVLIIISGGFAVLSVAVIAVFIAIKRKGILLYIFVTNRHRVLIIFVVNINRLH